MEDKTIRSTYLHDASAVAASGQIVSPFEDLIPTQAALALPVSGGYGSTRVEGFRYKEILSFGSAYTEVAGVGGKDGPFETLAVAAIEKLNILDVITCERMVCRIASAFSVGGKEPSFTTMGSRFERLRVGSYFWDELDMGVGVLADCPTWSKLQSALGNGGTRDQLKRLGMPAPNGDPHAQPGWLLSGLGGRKILECNGSARPDPSHPAWNRAFGTVFRTPIHAPLGHAQNRPRMPRERRHTDGGWEERR